MKNFVINLKRSTERRRIFDKHNSKYIDYEYIEGVDGSLLDKTTLGPDIINENCTFTKSSLGSALSHRKLWEKCIELNEPIHIMEDDAIVHSEFNSYLSKLMDIIPNDYDILLLQFNYNSVLSYSISTYEVSNSIFSQIKLTENDIEIFKQTPIHPTLTRLHNCFGIGSYIITPKCAKYMIENCFPLEDKIVDIPLINKIQSISIDCLMNILYKKINSYVSLLPFVLTPHEAEFNPSTMID